MCQKKVPDTSTTIVDLLRHGEVQGGACFRGSQDDPLSDNGWLQMHTTLKTETNWQTVISSPLKRCYAFASKFSSEQNLPLSRDARFQEMHFGDWEGKTAAQIMETHPELLTQFWASPDENSPPNGEPFIEFKKRILGAWHELANQYAGQHILLISHAGCIRTILAEVLQMPQQAQFRLELPLASMSRVKIFQDGDQCYPSLVFHGRTGLC